MAELLFCFWQAWHLRNNVIHGDGKASVHGSARFVASYWESLLRIRHGRDNDKKGKAPIYDMWNRDIAWNGGLANNHQDRRWSLPPYGWAKLNADQEKATLVWWLETDGLVLLTRWRHGVNVHLWSMLKQRLAWRGFVWLLSGSNNQPLLSPTVSLWRSP